MLLRSEFCVFICLYIAISITRMKGVSSFAFSAHQWSSIINRKSLRLMSSKSSSEFEFPVKMDKLVALCKSKGYVFPSSEVYGGLAGFYDFGPLGVELKNNIKKLWWRDMVQRREDMVGLDSSIISSSLVWKASGHLEGFSDPMVDCKSTNARFRADQVFWAALYSASDSDNSNPITYVCVLESGTMEAEAKSAAEKKAKALSVKGPFKPLLLQDLTAAPVAIFDQLPSPASGVAGDLTLPRDFNLMFQTSVGAVAGDASTAYLRPETAQGIFVNFQHIQRTSRMKIPFGIAQVGKAFRNEITPRNHIFRSREFEQMEIEYFIPPDDEIWQKHHEDWISSCWSWLLSIGLKEDQLTRQPHPAHKLAHYARACTDINFTFPFGTQELMGIAARGNYDLTQHSEHSGKPLDYFDEVNQVKFIPHVIEPSIGVERLFLALLTSAYREETVNGEKRVVLGLHPALAPIKASVFPLLSNKPELVSLAKDIYKRLQLRFNVDFDSSGAIGRRYRRADECGTPYCITVDFDSLSDGSVTVRDRDTMSQSRVSIDQLANYISERVDT